MDSTPTTPPSTISHTTIINPLDTTTHLIAINVWAQAPLKLTSTNYTAWRFQFQTLLTGYDLLGFIDGTKPCPPSTVMHNGVSTPNPDYLLWIRQDQLLLNAIIGSLTPSLISFIATAKTSYDAWTTLSNTYAKPTRGRILGLKNRLTNPVKGAQSITEFMQGIKTIVDALALMNVSVDSKDLVIKILDGLDENYKELSNAI